MVLWLAHLHVRNNLSHVPQVRYFSLTCFRYFNKLVISKLIVDQPIVVSSPVKEDSTDYWIPNYGLHSGDKTILDSPQLWLTDSIIVAVQSILKKQTKGDVYGWQSIQLAKTRHLFKPLPPQKLFVHF